jgi:hypothetical protein
MNVKMLLTVASIYLGLVGLGLIFAARQFGIGAVPADPSPALIEFLRILGGPFIGIAVMNWLARPLKPSPELSVVLVGNMVGFACVAASDVWGVFTGGARPAAKIFLVVHLVMAGAFVIAFRRTKS